MTKLEFLDELKKALCGLPEEDVQKSLDFYSEMIDDKIEDGLSEEEAVSQIGDIDEIAKQILMDTPITKLVKQKFKPRRMSVGEIVLLTLGSPIWLSLFIAAAAVVISVYVSLWAAVISLWAGQGALGGSALGTIVFAISLFVSGQNVYGGLAMIGALLFLIGFGIFFFFVCKASTNGMIWLTKRMICLIKFYLLRKEKLK